MPSVEITMGSSRNKGKDKKASQTKQAKKDEQEKVEPPKSSKKAAQEAKDAKAQANKKRPAPEPEVPAPPPPYQPETSELEKKRLQVSEELRKVEQQVSRVPCRERCWGERRSYLFSPRAMPNV